MPGTPGLEPVDDQQRRRHLDISPSALRLPPGYRATITRRRGTMPNAAAWRFRESAV